MNWTHALAFFLGAVCMLAMILYLLHRSHENFRKMCNAHPKGK